jgi:undecaprenyl-diphosphatase
MPIVILLLLALGLGSLVGLITWRYPPTRRIATTLAAAGAVLFGALAYLVGSSSQPPDIDSNVATWAFDHASPISTHVLQGVTQLGNIYTVIALGIVLAVVETTRERNVWVVPFLIAVIGGEELLSTSVKHLVDRARPTLNPAAAALSPAFPSGHSTTAAAFYAAAALLLCRRRDRLQRSLLAALATGIAVAVAATRVLLDLHWLTDVVGGLLLGWVWFATCSIAFSGRILRSEPRSATVSTSGSSPAGCRRRLTHDQPRAGDG